MERQGENCTCSWLRNVVTVGHKNKLLSFLSAKPVCYHFLIYKWVFVSHLTETDRTKNSVRSCSRWQMQYLIIFAENSLASMLCCCLWFWSVWSRPPSVRPPHFGGWVFCSYISAKNSEERCVLLLGSNSPPGIRHSHSCLRPCEEQVKRDIQPPTSFADRSRQTRWGKLRAGWGQKQCGSGEARCTRRSKNAEEKKKQMWEGGRKPSHGGMGPWGCCHPLLIYNLRQESSNCFCKGPKCKYFQLCGPYGLCHNYSIPPCSTDTVTGNTYIYEHAMFQ